ncbi:MAG TPA: mechanosensitive ion channel domain-containing protein [Burkholderiales bacterium]|nr:mechanosensitive ion channel domain-containing protein [Burkholderiales bacterium]
MNLEPSLLVLWDDLHEVHVLWQVGILAVSLGIAWWASRQLPQLGGPILKWKASAGGFKRVRFPLIALALVLIGRAILRNYHSVGLLTVAVPLLIALAISRAVVYMLRLTFPASGVLSASERLIAWLIWIGVALHLTGLAPELLDFLEGATFPLGKQHVSLLTVIQGLLSVCVALLVSLWLSRVLEDRVMKVAGVQMNLRVMLTKVLRPLLVLIGLLIALPAVGIDLTALSVFGGALGVGIGFGLQRIASNYISGFLILLDRSLSIGDLVTIDNHTGQVARLTARYVVVRKLDGTEVLVPNEFVITSTVVNHSYTDRNVRVPLPVQISYGSDLDAALRLMVEAARAQPRVLADPAPAVQITAFADSGINLELGVWISDPEAGKGDLTSGIYYDIWKKFRTHGIEIPFPQREVRLLNSASSAPST